MFVLIEDDDEDEEDDKLVEVILEYKFDVARITRQRRGTERTGSAETMATVRDGNGGPVSETK